MSKIPKEYHPVVSRIPDLKTDIFQQKLDPVISSNYDYPRFGLGFHHYIHTNKDKMSVLKEFEGKKQVYRVMNPFERNVDNHESDLNQVSKLYFDISPKPNILSRAFFKLWELMFMFDLVPLSGNFVSAHLAEGPGSFIQATMWFRDRYAKVHAKNDQYHAVTLHSEDSDHVLPMEKSFVDYYQKEKPVRFKQHKTYSGQSAGGWKHRDTGDLTDLKTIHNFVGGSMGNQKADLVTADGGFNWENENVQEQEATRLILGQIIAALNAQKKGGHFVCKLYEMFTRVSVDLICVLKHFYQEVYLVKPLMSRPSNSERYVVCRNFKYEAGDSKAKNNIQQLEKILERMKKEDLELTVLNRNFQAPDDLWSTVADTNIQITNRQLVSINRIVAFIDSNNYYGDVYEENRDEQIKGTDYWTKRFYPENKKFEEQRKLVQKETGETIKANQKRAEILNQKLHPEE